MSHGSSMLLHCLCIQICFVFVSRERKEKHSRSMHCHSHYRTIVRMPYCQFCFLLYLFYLHSLRSAAVLEHGNWVRGIRRPGLCHVPMLNDASSIHPVNVRQRNGFLVRLIDTHVDEADIVVEALSEHRGGDERDDWIRAPGVSIPHSWGPRAALLAKGKGKG